MCGIASLAPSCNDSQAPLRDDAPTYRGQFDAGSGDFELQLEGEYGSFVPLRLVVADLFVDAGNHEVHASVAIRNLGGNAVLGPWGIDVESFIPKDVVPTNGACRVCVTIRCETWCTFAHHGTYGDDRMLGPDETSTPVRWTFRNPSDESFSFRAHVVNDPAQDDGPLWLTLRSMVLDSDCDTSEDVESAAPPLSPDAPPPPASAPSLSPSDPSTYTAFKSLQVTPLDNVLTRLDGAGIELGGLSPAGVRLGVVLYWLRGEVRADSPAHGGLVNPYEIALDARGRVPSFGWGFFGMNGFAGIRGGLLGWKYAHSVFEVGHDWLPSLSAYLGIGVTPLRTSFLEVGVDLGSGFRGYYADTYKTFQNDIFKSGVFTQLSIEGALRF